MTEPFTIPVYTLLQDRYRVMDCIGGGGFSQVFEVEDGQTLKVLKVLDLAAFRQPQVRQKAIHLFQREAQFLSQTRHPGIPIVEPDGYFVWMLDDQTPLHCLVMEKIPGLNLQSWLLHHDPSQLKHIHVEQSQPEQLHSTHSVSQEQACVWLRQLVEILSHLHDRHFFHRDIKPANIILRPDGQLVLIDFGAVREITESYLKKQQGQESGTAIVSAGYTPPEQADGQAVPQSDFFALGRTMVCLLTGHDPLLLPREPHTGTLLWRDYAPQVSSSFADLIDQLMAIVPGQRPQTCQAILQALNQIDDEQHSRWRPILKRVISSRRNQSFQRIQQQRIQNQQTRQPEARWVDRFVPKPIAAGFLVITSITVWTQRLPISDQFNNWGLNAYEDGNHIAAQTFYQVALWFDPQSPYANFNLGDLYEQRQDFDRARIPYQNAMKGGIAAAYNNLGRLSVLDRDYREAVALLQQGMELAETDADRYVFLKNLGWAQLGLNQYHEAQTQLESAIALDPERAAAHCLLAQVHEANSDIVNATREWESCLLYADPTNIDERTWVELARSALTLTPVTP